MTQDVTPNKPESLAEKVQSTLVSYLYNLVAYHAPSITPSRSPTSSATENTRPQPDTEYVISKRRGTHITEV